MRETAMAVRDPSVTVYIQRTDGLDEITSVVRA